MTQRPAPAAFSFSVLLVSGAALALPAPEYLTTRELPTATAGFHEWPGDELSAIAFIPSKDGAPPRSFLILPDDRSKQAPARIGRIDLLDTGEGEPAFSPIRWTALRDEHGKTFEKNTVDPEGVRVESIVGTGSAASPRILWVSEGYAKGGVQPAIYAWTMSEDAATKWPIPDAFLHDDTEHPTRGIFHNNGFEAIAYDTHGGAATLYAPVERPLIQDEGTGVCRVLVDPEKADTQQLGYELGPAPEGTDAGSLAVAEMLCVGPRRFLVLENAERPDGETIATLWWASTDGASDLTGIASLKEHFGETGEDDRPRMIEKKLLLDLSTLPDNAGIGNFEGMDAWGKRLFLVEDNEHGESGHTRMLVLTLPEGLAE